uniref:Uncharacterized protein n=1 Tax=Myripristis murdjan TaxID=586833 RepID=A0A667WK04_9TELE
MYSHSVPIVGKLSKCRNTLNSSGAAVTGVRLLSDLFLCSPYVIVAAVTELEAIRRAVHEQLEVETIKNSNLRHQLHGMREKISREIMADVAAARERNAKEIEQLHNDINTVSQQQEAMVERQKVLLRQNAELCAEREQCKTEHENNTVTLSCHISQMSGLKVQLNQTLKDEEDLKTCIAAVKDNKVTLQHKMIQEMEALTVTNDGLVKEVQQTVKKIHQQRRDNAKNKRELDRVNDEIRDKNIRLSQLACRIAQLEKSITGLAASQHQCEKQLEEHKEMLKELAQQRETLEKQPHELNETFDDATQHLKELIATVDCEMEEGRAMGSILQDSLAEVLEQFTAQQRIENGVKAENLGISRRLEQSQLRLEMRIKSHNEISEMDEQITQLQEISVIEEDLFQKNRNGLQGQLEIERENISQFEEKKKQLSQDLDKAKKEQEEHVAQVTADIDNMRRRYQELERERVSLQQHQGVSGKIDSLMRLTSQAELDYKEMERTYQQEMQQIISETEHVTECSEEKEREVQEKEEALRNVEVRFDKEQSTHQRLEKLISKLRSQRDQLEMSIQELKENTCSLLQPKEEMKAQLEALRAQYLNQLDSQASELGSVERSIYNTEVKLEQVSMENSRLHLRIALMKDDVAMARKDRYLQEIHCFREEIGSLYEGLEEAWREDLRLTKERQGNDQTLLESMDSLLKCQQTRRLQLENISTHLNQQLSCISKLLDRQINLSVK